MEIVNFSRCKNFCAGETSGYIDLRVGGGVHGYRTNNNYYFYIQEKVKVVSHESVYATVHRRTESLMQNITFRVEVSPGAARIHTHAYTRTMAWQLPVNTWLSVQMSPGTCVLCIVFWVIRYCRTHHRPLSANV